MEPVLTSEQLEAVRATGNVLVVAGAGTGKTSTLVERCLAYILEAADPVALDGILMVTFTEAAAAEMRQRLRSRLDRQLELDPGNPWLEEQLARVETARISTLHSFCLSLIRDHFHELGLDPELIVLSQDQADLLASEKLEELLRTELLGTTPRAGAVQSLVLDYARGRDTLVRELVLRLHHYTQTLDHPEGWFEHQTAILARTDPELWREWLCLGFSEWRTLWLPELKRQPADNAKAATCARLLESLNPAPTRGELADALAAILALDADWPRGTKARHRGPLEKFYDEAAFLGSVAGGQENQDPLAADWNWVRGPMAALVDLAREFGARYAAAKRELAALDFHDLEQFALRLLWDQAGSAPTDLARRWQQQLRHILVDEVQDINPAQDRILTALAREGAASNRFLVGDVKQSIYRFRLADPRIFQNYAREWAASGTPPGSGDTPGDHEPLPVGRSVPDRRTGRVDCTVAARRDAEPYRTGSVHGEDRPPTLDPHWDHEPLPVGRSVPDRRTGRVDPAGAARRDAEPYRTGSVHGKSGRVLTLTGNFRSRPAILDFVNRLFAGLLRPEVGGIAYTPDQWLRPGSIDVEKASSPDPWPAVELHWIVGTPRSEGADDTSSAEREARLVAHRIEALMVEGRTVTDRQTGATRPLAWNDIAVLLRSPRTRAETYARVFGALGVPLLAGRGGFYDSLEISDLVSLLQILDNPHQDIPLLAVLRSPLAGFTPDDLVCLRVGQRRASLWGALKRFIRQGAIQQPQEDPDLEPGAARGSATDAEETRWLASACPGAWDKARVFVEAYQRWRELSRVTSLSECLETILEESGYEAWLAAQTAPDPALNRVRRLLALTRSFDQFQRQGLHRFVRFVEDRRDSEVDVEPAAATAAGAVRLLSVHQSKGLEFPVVVLADLGKRFNFDDLRAPVILDEAYGLCPLVQPPGGGPRYASLPHWLAGRRQRREVLGEELRLLYVACTRAREQLILCGTASRAAVEERWPACRPEFSAQAILEASHWLDWLGPWWFAGGGAGCDREGVARLHEPEDDWLRPPQGGLRTTRPAAPAPRTDLAPADLPALEQRLRQVYPHGPATREPGKVSVSQLRLRAQHAADEEARPLFIAAAPVPGEREQGVDAATRGTAHHLVLESISLAGRVTQGRLLETVAALRAQGGLSSEEVRALDLPAIIGFWQSELGVRIQGHHTEVHRELPFTGRFTAGDLESLGVPVTAGLGTAEYLVVQGVIDLAVLMPDRIWLLDFKTDRVSDEDLAEHTSRYRAQLRLYAVALERIYRRPVTECWLHFLHLRRSVAVGGAATPAP